MAQLSIVYRDFSFFQYHCGDLRIFVDPVYSEFDEGDWRRRYDVEPCDFVFVSHRHFDHFHDVLEQMDESDAVMVAARPLCDHVRRRLDLRRRRFVELDDRQSASMEGGPGFRVTALEMDHGGYVRNWRDFMYEPAGLLRMMLIQADSPRWRHHHAFVFELCGRTIVHIGEGFNDETEFEFQRRRLETWKADVVVCAADLDYSRDVADGVEMLDPELTLLYHPHEHILEYFDVPRDPLARFTSAIAKRKTKTKVLELGPNDRYDFED